MTDRPLAPTRMLFMGSAALTAGFQLIGFETWPDATTEQLDGVLRSLIEERQNAFVILDRDLARRGSPLLERVRTEGGRIVVTEIPPLNDPDEFTGVIDSRVKTLLGATKSGQV